MIILESMLLSPEAWASVGGSKASFYFPASFDGVMNVTFIYSLNWSLSFTQLTESFAALAAPSATKEPFIEGSNMTLTEAAGQMC